MAARWDCCFYNPLPAIKQQNQKITQTTMPTSSLLDIQGLHFNYPSRTNLAHNRFAHRTELPA